jgi:hypothetical protein
MENNFIDTHIHNNLNIIQLSPVIYNKDKLTNADITSDPLYLVSQFFIHKDSSRHAEILHCLKKNVALGAFARIYLVNERIYTAAEMQLSAAEMERVTQVVYDGGARMTYAHVCRLVAEYGLGGYVVIANSDIFFDKTVLQVRRSCLSVQRSLYALLRFEYSHERRQQQQLGFCKLFGPRPDSQDTWIYHTNFAPSADLVTAIDFMLGKPGCDNALVYAFCTAGYMIYNEPYNVKTYHYHTSQIRNYTHADAVPSPYIRVQPVTGF